MLRTIPHTKTPPPFRVTNAMVKNLQASLRHEVVAEKKEASGARWHVGAVWFGDWYHTHLRQPGDRGRFGSPQKIRHFAVIHKRFRHKNPSSVGLHPVTSQPKNASLHLPPGTLPDAGKFTDSYILYKIHLIMTHKTLETGPFDYRCTLAPETTQELVRLSKNTGGGI